ncbi:MAG: hypothetical protein IJJ65_10700 [Butyrivibrio sp.]|nr:hypothetical protein [Butyrivibrio sp.]
MHTYNFDLGPYASFVIDECSDEFIGFMFNIGYSKLTGNFQIMLQISGLSMGFVIGPDDE